MNKTLWWIGSLLWLLMLGTAEANDLNTYRYITEDGTALNITDTAYTRVAESTIAGKRYWIALHSENKADDRDTMIIKGKTNIHVTHISDFKITNITPDPDDATGKITEMEQMLPRQLFSRMKFTGASGTIGGKTWHLPQQRCKTMLLNNAVHIQASDGDTSLDLAKAGSLSGELHDQSSLPAHDRTWWSQYTMQHLQNAHASVMKYPLFSKEGGVQKGALFNDIQLVHSTL